MMAGNQEEKNKIQNPDQTLVGDEDFIRHKNAFFFSGAFPRISHIDDVVPLIRPNVGINAHVWGINYIGVNYAVSMPETFMSAIDLECRGMIFDRASGALMSRPMHKFFNCGERQAIQDLNFEENHWFEKKLDGSMIAAFVDNYGDIIYHTRGGFSSQAKEAGAYASKAHRALIRDVYSAGLSPVFEWTGPKNRIVIKYEQDSLTLLTLRERTSGAYVPRADIEKIAGRHGVAVAAIHGGRVDDIESFKRFTNDVRNLEGEEGVVMVFASGHRVKIKANAYQIHHKIISDLESEKNVHRAWANNIIDDIVGILQDNRGGTLAEFGAKMDRMMLSHLETIENVLDRSSDMDQKDRSRFISKELPKILQGAAFAMAKGQDGMDQMRRIMKWGLVSLENMAEVRKTFDLPEWSLGKNIDMDS